MAKAGSQGGVKGAGDKPVKPRAKTYSMGRDVPIEENLQELAKIVATPPNRKTVISRTDALYHLWTLAAADSEKRGEMLDVLLAAVLVKLINISSDETLKYNAIGCLQLISTDEDGCRQIAKAKAQPQGKSGVTVIAELMHGTHDRSKISAAAILYEMSTHYELMHDLIPVIPAMLRLIDHEDPEWSGIKKSHAYIATAIRNLLFNINQEQASQARVQLFKHGGIPRLVALLKRGPKEAATSAVACLRDLAPHPDMVDVIVESEGIQNLIMLLEHGVEEQKALASACMCELSTHDCCQDVMVACGALIPLVKCLSWAVSTTTAQAAALGRKGRRKRQGHTGSKRSPPLPPAIDMAVTNASATLYHLSFIDQVKVSIRECGAIPLLVSLLHANNFIIQGRPVGLVSEAVAGYATSWVRRAAMAGLPAGEKGDGRRGHHVLLDEGLAYAV
eukprot:jgi/Tetstr1/449325/TSEL_003840.t1